jgi:hypothetical protein
VAGDPPLCVGATPNHTARMPNRPADRAAATRASSPRPLAVLSLLACALALGGCDTIRGLFPESRKEQEAAVKLLQLQSRNMRYADEYVGSIVESTRHIEIDDRDATSRYALSGWMLAEANAAYTYASAGNAIIATLDLITLATLSRMVVEQAGPTRFPDQAAALLTAHREMESKAWELADGVLNDAQQAELRRLLTEWRAKHPTSESAPFVRFQEFVSEIPAESGARKGKGPGSLMGLVGLDPMAGLDPAVRQVEESRLLADRALYYAQRVPIILDLQLDRAVNRLAAGPESQRLQQQTASLSESARRFAAVAEALPGTLATERETLIRQLNETLLAQATNLRPLLVEMRGTLEAGSAAAASVDQATRSIDALVARLAKKPGEPDNGKPFDVNEYTQAAAEITRAANQLEQLLNAAGSQSPQMAATFASGAAQGRTLVDYLFVRVAWLIALLCAGLLATLLLYHWIAPRVRPT